MSLVNGVANIVLYLQNSLRIPVQLEVINEKPEKFKK